MAYGLRSPDQIVNEHIAKPWKQIEYTEAWRNLPEVPKKSEICPNVDPVVAKIEKQEAWNDYQNEPRYETKLPENIVEGPWPSREDYIGAHYQILREDAVAPLRRVVSEFKRHPHMVEDSDVGIYTHVTFRGIQLSPVGAAFRVEFSNERAGKLIRWDQSKRLMQGSIVAITTQRDNFHSICKIAVVAARPLEGLQQNPPQVDLFWGDDKDTVFDPSEEYIMVEARSSYFEASRHMLEALQKLMTEKFPLADHIAMVDPMIGPPAYVEDHSIMDLSSLPLPTGTSEETVVPDVDERLLNVDVLESFPEIPASGMDDSQMSALQSMLVKKVAIIQGPPGTGKTFVSVAALKVMMANMQSGDPPIIVSAQTNHALDQLLNHILKFEDKILRLGGRSSKENEEIRKRTIYEYRQSTEGAPNKAYLIRAARRVLRDRISEIQQTMMPIINFSGIIDLKIFLDRGIITQGQYDSLAGGDWDGDDMDASGFASWLPGDQLEPIPRTPLINSNFELEEGDIEQEQLKDLEAEAGALRQDENDPREALSGEWLGFSREFNGRDTGMEDKEIKRLLSTNKSLHGIPAAKRGDTYRYLVRKLDSKMKRDLKSLLSKYRKDLENLQVAKWTANIALIKHLGIKLIGCTTTGLSKYRGLLAALESRTLLIEEAAETLEGTVIAGMIDSLQQLILVGDHQQLQAHCNVKTLEEAPYHMNVSMFERLVKNSIGYVMLNKQRRMIPDIRGLLCVEANPFYLNLRDHDSVLELDNRPPVPGMGGINVYFFHHTWTECRNADMSINNQDEAQMIVAHFNHLLMNGVDANDITILTFYNGQRKAILHQLKRHPGLSGILYFKVFTVDSYQGEENDIIILSLVRSNSTMSIGFLENKNRLVVALSRARRGLYIYGNSTTLTVGEESENYVGRDPLWWPLIEHMKYRGWYNFDRGLPIYCERHKEKIYVEDPDDWVGLNGGCSRECEGSLDCGHSCPYACHPFDHSTVECAESCPLMVECGHPCRKNCGSLCQCDEDGCPYSFTHLQAPLAESNDLTVDIRTEDEIAYGAAVRKHLSATHHTGSHQQPLSLPDKAERVRAWNSWDAKEFDVAQTETLAASSATYDISNESQNRVFREDFKPVKVADGKRKRYENASTKQSSELDIGLGPSEGYDVLDTTKASIKVDESLPTQKQALLFTMLSPTRTPKDIHPTAEEGAMAESLRSPPGLKDNHSTISEWQFPESSKALVSNLRDATLSTKPPQKYPATHITSPVTDETQLQEDFDLLSFDEPLPKPITIQASDLDMFEAQFG